MAVTRNKVINGVADWREKGRYKVNSVVRYNGVSYQNVTGKNSNPENSNDWFALTWAAYRDVLEYDGSTMFQIPSSEKMDLISVLLNGFDIDDFTHEGTDFVYTGTEPLSTGDALKLRGIYK